MTRRRDVLRRAGSTAAGGLATALAGCTARSSDGDATDRLGMWAYDPAEYGDGWQRYSIDYLEPVTLSTNRTYLTETQWQQVSLGTPWADAGDLDYVLEVGAEGESGSYPYPSLAVVEGSFGTGDVRRSIADSSTRVGTVEGSELYVAELNVLFAVDHGEVVIVRNLDQHVTEAYLRQSDRSFIADTPEFGQLFDRVGVGAYTSMRLADDGIEGFSYHLDGPTTTVKAMRPGSETVEQRQQFERRVSTVGSRLGYPDAATVEYGNGSVFVELRMATHEATIGRDPFAMIGES